MTARVLTLEDVSRATGEVFGIRPALVRRSLRRHTAMAAAKAVAAYVARRVVVPRPSYPEIAQHLHRNHSSIIDAEERAEKSPELRHAAVAVLARLAREQTDAETVATILEEGRAIDDDVMPYLVAAGGAR